MFVRVVPHHVLTASAPTSDPPVETIASGTAQLVVVVLLAVVLTGALAYASWRAVALRRPVMLFMVLGAGLCGFTEPVWDILANIWFSRIGQWTGFTALGRDIPVWIFGAYALYWGLLPYVLLRLLGPDPSRKRLATGLASLVLANAAIELPLILTGLHHYYGPQGVTIAGLPLHWMLINATAAFLVGTTAVRLDARLRGWGRLGVLLVPPLVQPATSMALGWPFFITVNGQAPIAGIWGASALVVGTALLVLFFVAPLTLPAPAGPGRRSPGPEPANQRQHS